MHYSSNYPSPSEFKLLQHHARAALYDRHSKRLDQVSSVARDKPFEESTNFKGRMRRVLAIARLLHLAPCSSDALATDFSVSRRTVLRDIEALRSVGEPIEFDSATSLYFVGRETSVASDVIATIHAAARSDYELLTSEDFHIDATGATDFLGPLWPFGKPEGWPEDEVSDEPAREPKLLLELTVPDDADDDEVTRLVEEATKRASALHIAHGGAGLVVDDLQIHSPARVPEEAPVG